MMFELIELLINSLGPIATASKENEQKKDLALRSVSYALDETYLYYRDMKNGHLKDRDREAQLVKLWSAAAIPLRHFDLELARICENKSKYWIDPESYSDEDVVSLGIRLGDVRIAYRKLMKPQYGLFRRK